MAERLRSVVLSRADLRLVSQRSVMTHDDAWKIYWWGGHRDQALIRSLQSYPAMGKLRVGDKPLCQSQGYGFQKGIGGKARPEWLRQFKQLPAKAFRRYGPIAASDLRPVPDKVYRHGAQEVYSGVRLLFKRGVGRRTPLVARLETKPYCFTHSIFGIRVPDSLIDEARIVLGICWSSLAKYYLWMTSGSWGLWHDAVHKSAVLDLPIRFPDDRQIRRRILKLVDDLSATDGRSPTCDRSQLKKKERALDEAIFDLYQLTESERDLVLDTCRVGLDLFYQHAKSDAVKPVQIEQSAPDYGLASDLPSERRKQRGLEGYIRAFLSSWNCHLSPEGEFIWRVIKPAENSPMLAVIFSSHNRGVPVPASGKSGAQEWQSLLADLDRTSRQGCGSERIIIDGLTRIVSDTHIVIIKRNEQRLWTRSAAREDAEATFLQAILRQEAQT
ncbi:MAG: hypothetical protein IMF16_05435 [Proteobacteria bacterium]|nr:hypothetical protein [Pseudomonadota bacterium]